LLSGCYEFTDTDNWKLGMAAGKRIGLREVRALRPNEIAWDSAVLGFGARRQRGAVIYVLKYRVAGTRQRWHSIGRHGAPWTPDTARNEARRLLGEVARGGDPAADKRAARHALTMSELCDRYLADAACGRLIIRGGRTKKPRTVAGDRGMIAGHIKPLLGRQAVARVTRTDIEKFMRAVAEGKTAARNKTDNRRGVSHVRGGMGTASRTVGLLGSIFSYAVRHDLRPDNPVRGVSRPADGRRERRLTDDEYRALGGALQSAQQLNIWPPAVAVVRFLTVTGWRTGEALSLQWSEIDLTRRTATLVESKTGRSMRPLSHAACVVLQTIATEGSLVFPPSRGDGHMSGFRSFWGRIAKLGGLPADVTPHVLRHSFASLAADLGYSEPTIAALVGHKSHSITSRYIHSADAVLLAAADAVAERALELMGADPACSDLSGTK
jgi:integrase